MKKTFKFTKKDIVISVLILIVLLMAISMFVMQNQNKDLKNNKNEDNGSLVEKTNDVYLVLSINPKIMLKINNEVIKEIYHLNDDAKVFKNDDLKGLSLEEGIKKVSDIAKDNGFIKKDTVVNVAYYNSKQNDIDKISQIVKNTFDAKNLEMETYEVTESENEEIKKVLNQNKIDNTIEEKQEEIEETNKTNSNKNNNSNTNESNKENNNSNVDNGDWENIGDNIYHNGPTTNGECTYSMVGVNFKTPSWFKLYPGDRWATQKEYNRVNPASDLVVYIRESYDGYDSIEGNDGIHRYTGTFLQFLPDDINCIKNWCNVGDKECYEELHYVHRSRLNSEKETAESYEIGIKNYNKTIKEAESKIPEIEAEMKKYCSNMTDENQKCVYTEGNYEHTWYNSIADYKETLKYYNDVLESSKKSIEQDKRILHYQKLRVYQQQMIYNFVKENFPI